MPVDPGFEVILEGLQDQAIGLKQAADKTGDPTASDKLASAGFTEGWYRYWSTPGALRRVTAEILVFETPDGAARFHRQLAEFACLYADEAFAGTNEALGFRLRFSDPDSVVEQVGWVDGARRIEVTRGYGQAPRNHSEILDLAARANEQLANQP